MGDDNNTDRTQERLPPERVAAVTSGLEQFQAALHKAETAARERDDLQVRLQAMTAERDVLKGQLEETQRTFSQHFESIRENYAIQVNEAQSRSVGLQAERDTAVADRSFLESVLSVIRAAIEKAELPQPIRREKRGKPEGSA